MSNSNLNRKIEEWTKLITNRKAKQRKQIMISKIWNRVRNNKEWKWLYKLIKWEGIIILIIRRRVCI